MSKETDTLDYLIKQGADIEAKAISGVIKGLRPLPMAALNGRMVVVRFSTQARSQS